MEEFLNKLHIQVYEKKKKKILVKKIILLPFIYNSISRFFLISSAINPFLETLKMNMCRISFTFTWSYEWIIYIFTLPTYPTLLGLISFFNLKGIFSFSIENIFNRMNLILFIPKFYNRIFNSSQF